MEFYWNCVAHRDADGEYLWSRSCDGLLPAVTGTPNFDGTTRSVPLMVTANGQVYPSLVLETLRALRDQPSYQTKITPEAGVEWVRMGRDKPITTTPTSDVMVSYWNKFHRISAVDLSESNFENKILVWGLTAEGLNNPVSTPRGVMYPHEVQSKPAPNRFDRSSNTTILLS